MRTLVREDQRQICILVVMNIPQPQCDKLILRKRHFVAFECRCGAIKGQILPQGTHLFKYISVRILDHPADLFRRSLHTGGSLPDIDAGRLQAFAFQIIRLIASLSDFYANDFIVLQNIAHKYRYIRRDGIPNAIGQTGIGFIHIIDANYIALIVDADVDHAAFRVSKGNDFLVNVVDHRGLIFHTFVFVLHIWHLPIVLPLLYSVFSLFQWQEVKIHFKFTSPGEFSLSLTHRSENSLQKESYIAKDKNGFKTEVVALLPSDKRCSYSSSSVAWPRRQ